ncbi:MAG: hypothetical protein A3F84_21965 [Candidatus Handelsmanbacteria bacterium RIFCSPLOWO2_12_FULL_64_10]|uniref:Uncharacterized protein n=1 Tax=Handelsmanbacteria sp. (strain RIFCSPLOWO2_12_FULL_64_10) TaxID=1817868 RepID=A0A1F6CG12_HANXR|nr:MAG: hypothetical protein A3F84_21965 [Candidatus Handelsmanbacteria bacterium RIFCSPLOWO2_12_FULL_64_10]
MATSGPFEEHELASNLSVEFTLLSGETISVRDNIPDPVSEGAIRRYAEDLVGQLKSDSVRTFAYWWAGDFYVDAVRLHEVAALSVSPVSDDDDDEDWEEGE